MVLIVNLVEENYSTSPLFAIKTRCSFISNCKITILSTLRCCSREGLYQTSLHLWWAPQSSLHLGESWLRRVASRQTLFITPTASLTAALFSSISLCGPNSWPTERARGGARQSPNPTNSVSETMHFPCLCVRKTVHTPTRVCLLLASPGSALPHPIWAQNGLGPMCQGSHCGD